MRKLFFGLTIGFVVVLVAGLYSCQSPQAAPGTVLKFNLEKGKSYNYEMVWDIDQKVMEQETKIRLLADYTMNVTEDDGKIKTMTGTYNSFKMNIKMMGMEIDVDTEKPAAPLTEEEIQKDPLGMIGRMYTGIKGKSFVIKVNEEGQVVDVTGFETIVKSMVDSLSLPDEARLQVEVSLRDQFSDEMIKDQFGQAFFIFPNKAVKAGDTWQKVLSIKGKSPSTFTTDYTVKSIEADIVTLDSKSTITSADSNMELSGTQTGQLLVDSKSGLVMDAEMNQELKVVTQGTEVNMTTKGKVTGKLN